ncbi:MAG TPA: FKBP-type peptidyl-prolyl cis-trans isomerase [Candidatus Alistipes faecigallinarum]|uniref:FKBP-type peptidyl-prolyl cis-trans isomerase n=1 Tax=uncultured Alistipes sp. TaxID=538949 RepID=UPI001F983F04|nr:FKBP-type peptidyl-prolyl cis-trans isomerase [uncultured Alistipes sp.]HIY48170.1 FKBP-type peptidyl-prolyl cis-trans isomerase [Candidatus Alistipes faecigallinarum]
MKKIIFAAVLAGAAALVSCKGGNQEGIQMGSLSKFDSLSYAVGANIGYGLSFQMKEIPLDPSRMREGLVETASGKSAMKHDEAVEILREYFMNKRGERMQAIMKQRAEADSIRLASGDTTKVEYPVADPAMFLTEEERDSVSYALGNDIGYAVTKASLPLHIVWVGEALQNVFENNARMDQKATNSYLQHYYLVTLPMQNEEASTKWLSKIEKKSGVQKTESGLLYKVIEAGDMTVKAADKRDVVKVHYTGRTRTGRVFDATHFADRPEDQQEMLKQQFPDTYNEDKPAEFPLNGVIPGWAEGLQLVGKGGKIMLWIPASLAYGPTGRGAAIGPNEALEFEVELVDVEPYAEPAPAADSTATAEAPAAEPAAATK